MLWQDLLTEIRTFPVVDIHSHLDPARLSVRHPAEFMLYHMLQYELAAAGAAPTDVAWHRQRLEPPDELLRKALPYFARLGNTSFAWCLRTILGELYEVREPLADLTVGRLCAAVSEKTAQPDWAATIMRRGNLVGTLTSMVATVPPNSPFRVTFEDLPVGWTEYAPEPLQRQFLRLTEKTGIPVDSVAAFERAIAVWAASSRAPACPVFVTWLSGSLAANATDAIVQRAVAGEPLTSAEQAAFTGLLLRSLAGALHGRARVLQYVLGCRPMASNSPVRLPVAEGMADLGVELGRLAVAYPDLHFNVLNGYELAEPSLCTAAARLPNLSLGSFWWHGFYPSIMHTCWQRRLEMVPLTGLCAFFSDAYCVEWQYARLRLTQNVLARVLADRIEAGLATPEEALHWAKALLWETPRGRFLLAEPAAAPSTS